MTDRERIIIRERLHELDLALQQRDLSEAEWDERGMLLAALEDRDQAAQCFAKAEARRKARSARNDPPAEPDGEPAPRMVLGMPVSARDAAIVRKQREAYRVAAGLPPPTPIAAEDIAVAIGILLLVYFVLFFDTSVQVPSGSIMGHSYGGERVNNIGLMQDRMIGIIIGLASLFGGLLPKFLRSAVAARPDREHRDSSPNDC